MYANSPPELVNTVPAVIELAHTRWLFCTAQRPLLDASVKPVPEAVAVKPAHVPVVYHVPPLMMQPSALPPVDTWSVPLPEKGVPGTVVGVGVGPGGGVVVVVVVGAGGVTEPDFGRYLMPVAGQAPLEPSVTQCQLVLESRDRMVVCTWGRRNEGASLHAALHVIEIPDLIELICVFALDNDIHTPRRLECRHDRGACVCSCRTRHDPGTRKPGIAGQSLEQIHRRGEVVYHLFLRDVVGVAAGVERADACAMFLPFVIPKALIVAVDVFPVCIHIAQHGGCACSSEDGRYIGVGSTRVAVGIVCAVAVVGP